MKLAKTIVASLLAAAALTAQADTITNVTDGTWNQFFFGDNGSTWLDDYAFNSPGMLSFSIELSGPAILKITDAGLTGDIFQIFDNGNALGFTSAANTANTTDIGVDYDSAYASSDWSHGQWILSAGTHLITGIATTSFYGAGDGAIQVATVPEPSSFALALCGLGLIGLMARRRV